MKTIIAPTDFSEVAENACLYAARLAADIQADLILLHAMELPVGVGEYPIADDFLDEEGMEKSLATLKEKLLAAVDGKVRIRTKNILGYPGQEIKALCEAEKPFAVVIATHNSALDRFFMGSITVYSAKHLPYPVIVVPRHTKYQTIKRIAFASDLKDVYDVPAQEIKMIVKLFDAELDVFYVGKNEKVINQTGVDNSLLTHRLAALNPRFRIVENKDIMAGIADLAKKYQTDLLIIIPKKHGPFHKSQSKDFVFRSDVPVMAIHEYDLIPAS